MDGIFYGAFYGFEPTIQRAFLHCQHSLIHAAVVEDMTQGSQAEDWTKTELKTEPTQARQTRGYRSGGEMGWRKSWEENVVKKQKLKEAGKTGRRGQG